MEDVKQLQKFYTFLNTLKQIKMATVNPYLTFKGNCEEAFTFYKSIFGGDFPYIGRFKDMPAMEGHPPVPDAEGEKIMHVSLPISKETILMGSDSSEAFGNATIVGNNFSLSATLMASNLTEIGRASCRERVSSPV